MKVNNIEVTFIENTTIQDLLNLRNEGKTAKVVVIGSKAIKKSDYDTHMIKEDDEIKVITTISGG